MMLGERTAVWAKSGTNVKTIVYDGGPITNTLEFKNWAISKLGSEHWFLVSKSLATPTANNQIHGGMLDFRNSCLRYRNEILSAYWDRSFDATVNSGDEFYCVPNPQYG